MKAYQESVLGPWSRKHAAHLLRRMVVGPTPEEITRAVQEGREATVERLLRAWVPVTTEIDHFVTGDVLTEIKPIDTPEYAAFFDEMRGKYVDLLQWWALQIVRGPLSAQERMVFWWHMYVPASFTGAHFAEHIYDQTSVMRDGAFGNVRTTFEKLLHGMAVQIYLSGIENRWHPWFDGTNENLAREMLELYLLGRVDRDGKTLYTQHDVSEIARALSGWRLDEYRIDDGDGRSRVYRRRAPVWREDHWDPRTKHVFGADGAFNSADILSLIFDGQPLNVARHVCRRWFRSFVDPSVNEDFVEEMARMLVDHSFEIKPLLRAVLNSTEFYMQEHRMTILQPAALSFLGQLRYSSAGYCPDFDDARHRYEDDLIQRLHSLGQCMCFPPNVSGWYEDVEFVPGSAVAWRLELRRRLWAGELVFKDYDGGRPVYPIDIARFSSPEARRHCAIDLLDVDTSDLTILQIATSPLSLFC